MRLNPSLKSYPSQIVANNAKTKLALSLAESMASIDDPVIIHGVNGTGKDLFAKTIQQHSNRKDLPFVCLHGSMISKQSGKKQIAECLTAVGNGTLLLDELQDLDLEGQKWLCDNLTSPAIKGKIRIITTTSFDLDKLSGTEKFSPQLLETLRGGYIELLPLHERKEDIATLVEFYVDQICRENSLPEKNISSELLRILETYHWPGNVRELVNTVEQLVLTAQKKQTLFTKDLPSHIRIQTLKSSAAHKQGL